MGNRCYVYPGRLKLLLHPELEHLAADAEPITRLNCRRTADLQVCAVHTVQILHEHLALFYRKRKMSPGKCHVIFVERDIGGLTSKDHGLVRQFVTGDLLPDLIIVGEGVVVTEEQELPACTNEIAGGDFQSLPFGCAKEHPR